MIYALLCGPSMTVFAQNPTPTPEPTVTTDEEKPAEEEKPGEEPTTPAKPQPQERDDTGTFIGRGYDITGEYANMDSAGAQIFDLTDKDVRPEPNPRSTYTEISGKTLSEYQTKFSNNLKIEGSYKIFSGSVKANFSKDDSSSTAREYMTIMNTVIVKRYQMGINEKTKVSAAAREAIDTGDISQLFKDYGTHYIFQADVGGRVDYNLTLTKIESQKNIAVEVALAAAVKALVASVSIENETKFSNNIKKLEEAGKVTVKAIGGSLDASTRVRANTSYLPEWALSVEAKPTLAGFTTKSLRPIWKLASTPERQAEIEEAFRAFVQSSEIKDVAGNVKVANVTGAKQVASNWNGRGTDGDGNAAHRFAAWSPVSDTENGYYVVGHAANRDSRTEKTGTIKTIMVKEIGPQGSMLAAPIDFTPVTEFTGGRQWSIWRAVCPANFVSLGDFAKWDKSKPNMDIPDQNPFKDVRCVSVGATEAAAPLSNTETVYNNDGSGEWGFVAYKIKPTAGSSAINGNFFYGVRVDSFTAAPPEDAEPRVLKNPAGAGMSFLIREGSEDYLVDAFQGLAISPAGFDPDVWAVQIAISRFRLSDISLSGVHL